MARTVRFREEQTLYSKSISLLYLCKKYFFNLFITSTVENVSPISPGLYVRAEQFSFGNENTNIVGCTMLMISFAIDETTLPSSV